MQDLHYSLYALLDCEESKYASDLLQENNLKYVLILLDNDPDYLSGLKKQTGLNKTPIITVSADNPANSNLMGGLKELRTYIDQNKPQ